MNENKNEVIKDLEKHYRHWSRRNSVQLMKGQNRTRKSGKQRNSYCNQSMTASAD